MRFKDVVDSGDEYVLVHANSGMILAAGTKSGLRYHLRGGQRIMTVDEYRKKYME